MRARHLRSSRITLNPNAPGTRSALASGASNSEVVGQRMVQFTLTRRPTTARSDGRDYRGSEPISDASASRQQQAVESRVCHVVTARIPML